MLQYVSYDTHSHKQCQNIFERFLKLSDFRVVLLGGTGDFPSLRSDAELVRNAIIDLGFSVEQ